MHFGVVTPCYQAAGWLEQTVRSVMSQTALSDGTAQLTYLIQDGGSTDGSIEAITKIVGDDPRVRIKSERDGGMYDALSKAFDQFEEHIDVVSYINAGDKYFPNAFEVVQNVITAHGTAWLTGYDCYFNSAGAAINVRLPVRYRAKLMAAGLYGRELPALQQESTFWQRSLLDDIDLRELASYRLAGDHYLWTQFSKRTEVAIVRALLGGFTYHGKHLSDNGALYRQEVERHAERRGLGLGWARAALDYIAWRLPEQAKVRLNGAVQFTYDRHSDSWVSGGS